MAVDFELGCVLLPLGDDSDDLRTIADNDVMCLGESIDVDPAVRAPMAPMKSDGDRALPQQILETY